MGFDIFNRYLAHFLTLKFFALSENERKFTVDGLQPIFAVTVF